MWESLKKLENHARTDVFFRSVLATLSWPMQQWYRRILIGLSEHEFKVVPAWVHEQVSKCFRGFMTTKISEDCFHQLLRLQSCSENGSLSRLQRWQGATESGLLEAYDRKPARACNEALAGAQAAALPRRIFESDGGGCSIPDAVLQQLWTIGPTPSPESFNESHLLWMACMQVRDLAELKLAWLSLLMLPGSIVSLTGFGGGLVVHACAHGVLLWRVDIERVGVTTSRVAWARAVRCGAACFPVPQMRLFGVGCPGDD